MKWRVSGRGKQQIPVVEIRWVDAISVAATEWVDNTTVSLHGAPSIAVGYLIGETDTCYTIVALVNNHHYAHGITIPKGCVEQIVTLT
jgi:hypothetical protein